MNPDLAAPSPGARPSGTVTFAFTDIEGSTQRWDLNRAAMQAAVRRHDELMRAAIAEYGGHVFKTVGDAFCVAFARPEDAVPAMLAAQLSLAAEDFSAVGGIRVRAAIHTGTADERGGDYYGPAVNRVARLLAIGHGGQVLVSGVSADLVAGELPPQARLRDLGEHRLRDLARPEYVYQLIAPGLEPDFPALRSLDALPNNLPRMPNALVGREVQIAEIAALIEKNHLVTLVGTGGAGKTRTALQVAANLLDGSGDGVWFIELAPLTSGDYIPSVVAQAFGITLAADGDPLDNLVRALKAKRALLVFDNCEHLVEPASRVVAALIRSCPQLRVLATSRQGLGIAAEATYRIPSLELPAVDENAPLQASDATRFEAIALFVERARAVDNRFALTDENTPIVADICRRLDGIPLAIELAASRVKILSPRQLRERLNERFRILTGGSRDVLPRQQTLRALIDWSHDLLDERERVLFRRLSVFVNGFTLDGASAVGRGDDLDELDVFDVLASLVDKSLVVAEPDGDSLRYRLLESTRAYAGEKLANAGEADLVAQRHLCYLRDRFAEIDARSQQSGRHEERIRTFNAEIEDIRAALDRASQRADTIGAATLLAEIGSAWGVTGEAEGFARIDTVFHALPEEESLLRSRLATVLSRLVNGTGRKARARELMLAAIGYARASGTGEALADALAAYARLSLNDGALDDADRALTEAESIPGTSPRLREYFARSPAFLAGARGDVDAALRVWEAMRKRHQSTGNAADELDALLGMAELEHRRGNTQRAIALARAGVEKRRSVQDDLVAFLLMNLAAYLLAVDDILGGADAAREAIGLFSRSDPESPLITVNIEHLALACALDGAVARAAVLEGYVDAALHRQGGEREFTELTTQERVMGIVRSTLAPDDLARYTADGAALSTQDAVALAPEKP